jgi:uncharacterized membrane protein
MKTKLTQGLAILLIIEIGLTHYFTAQHEFEESWILGYLFIFNFLGAILAAYGIYRRKLWGWVLGLSIALGSTVGYIWSRTSGLPGLNPEEWLDPWGVSSLAVEVLFYLVTALHFIWTKKSTTAIQLQLGKTWRNLVTSGSLIALIVLNFSVYQWESQFPEAEHGHVLFLWQVRLEPQISLDTLEKEYGLGVPRITNLMMDSIVNVRMKVFDQEKADQLFEEETFALLVGDMLIPAPHIHRHLLENHTIILFFPNLNNTIKSGTPVSLVFANLRVEPISAR